MRTFSSRLTLDRIPARRAASVGTCPQSRPLAPVHPQVQVLLEIFQGQEILPSYVRAALHYPWLRFIDANVEQRFLHYAQGRGIQSRTDLLGWVLHALLVIVPLGFLSASDSATPLHAYLTLWPHLLLVAVSFWLMATTAKDTPFNVIVIEMLFGCLLRMNVLYVAHDDDDSLLRLRLAFASALLAVVLIIDCSGLRFTTATVASNLVNLQFVGFVVWYHNPMSIPLELMLYILYTLVVTGVTLRARFRDESRLRMLYFIMNCYHPPLDDSAARGASQRKTMELLDILSRAIPALESIAVLPAARDTQKMLERSWGLLSGTIDVPDEEWEYLPEEDREVLDTITGERFFNEAMDTNLSRLSMRMRDDIAISSPSSVMSNASVRTEAAPSVPRRDKRTSTFTHGVAAAAVKSLITLNTPLPSPTHMDIDLHNAPSRQSQSPAVPPVESDQRNEPRSTSRFHVLDVHFPLFSHFKRLEATQRSDPPLLEIARPTSPVNSDWELPDLLAPITDGSYTPILSVGFSYLSRFCTKGILHSDSNVLKRFLWCLQNLYLDNPYHNAFHAAQVMHSSCWLAKTILEDSFEEFDQMSLAVAALAHDVGHPARTNGFLCATGSILSRVYNDQSVLENYHAALLFTVLASSRYDIFEQTSRKDFFAFRKFAIEAILSTDMADHFEFLNRAKLRFCATDFDVRTQEEDKSLFYSIVIKAGDLSHTAVSWDHHLRWSKLVGEEFYLQGDEEARRSLPISSLCDRSRTNARDFARGQLSFLQFVSEPIYDQLETLDSSGRVRDQCLTAMVRNKLRWQTEEDVAAD